MKLRAPASLLALGLAGLALLAPVRAEEPTPISPTDRPIVLFNGKNLDGLYTFLKDTKLEDPRKVFTVKDGLLHISGDGFGAATTKQTYRDYHLVIEFKWGERTWHEREKRARDSGVLVHATGPDGGYSGIWMNSIEAQIIEGGVGDILAVRGAGTDGKPLPISVTAEVEMRGSATVWKAGGMKKTIQGGRIDWYGRDPKWTDTLGFRGKEDVESPFGQWTRMDVVCDKDRVTIFVNGVKVNEAFDVIPSAGKIQVQTELAEMYVRRLELWPLGKAPKFDAAALNPAK